MICANCTAENPPDAKFCVRCGTRMGCPNCKAPIIPGARFCANCGTRLVADEAAAATGPGPAAGPTPGAGPPPDRTTERRVVTVLFADLVGFTALSATRDSETIRELQSRYFERTREIIARYGGIVEKFIGDAVMALWGAPTAHEDDAQRAVRAALDLVEMVPLVGHEMGVDLQLRAGVLTGEAAVAVGADSASEGMVTGDMVNTASRLQSAAEPGTVLVGEATRLAAGEAIVFESAGGQVLKGKAEPVPAWRATRVVAEVDGARRGVAIEPPFVGRAEELHFLKEQFHSTSREGRARLVSLVGQAGIGKSRLAWELEKYLDGVVEPVWWHRGRSPSYGEGVTFWALSEMFRRRAGLAEGDDEDTTRRAVAEMLRQHVPDEAERAWIEPRILVLLGVGDATPGGSAELFAAWRTFFERLAVTGTVVLVVEDLQWSDDGLLDFLEHLLDWGRSSPIFVLTLARPELLDRRQGWGTDRRGATAMRLDPLPDAAMRELLDGVAQLSDKVAARIIDRADGIPLYAVETLRMLVAKGQLVDRGGRLGAAADGEGAGAGPSLGDLEVPPTLQALVAARLDALTPADRSLLQDAAVLGQTFTVEALAAMSGETPEALVPRLATLVRREILTLETDPRAPTRGQHAFVQAILREVAFSTLSKRERRARHLTAARYFESLGDEEAAGAVASHFIEAYRAVPDGPEGEAVATQARISLLATAERAEELGALRHAVDALASALEVTPDAGQRAHLLERIGQLQALRSDWAEAYGNMSAANEAYAALGDRIGVLRASARLIEQHLTASRIAEAELLAAGIQEEAAGLVDATLERGAGVDRRTGEAAALVAEVIARLEFRLQNFADSIRWADRALALAEPLHLDETLGLALVTKGTALGASQRVREGIALLEGAVLDATAHRQNVAALRGLNNVASLSVELNPRASLERTRLGIATARRLGMRSFDGYHAANAVSSAEPLGEWAWAREAVSAMVEEFPDRDESEWLETARDYFAAWTGKPDVPRAERLLAQSRRDNDLQAEWSLAGYLARCAFAAGDAARALEIAEPFMKYAGRTDAYDFEMIGRYALHAGKLDLARRVFELAESSPGGPAQHRLEVLAAGIAALEGRRDDAVALYRSGLDGHRSFGLRFTLALGILDMASFLGPDDPAVRSVIDEGREILEALGARPLLERLDGLTPRGGAVPSASAVQGAASTT